MNSPRQTQLCYQPQLDGLRALAVLAVAWSHWAPHHQFGISFGFGVHLFFVLSGYLITGILLEIRTSADRWHGIRMFYLRRALRIFPAYYLTIAVTALAAIPLVRETWPWHVAYLTNVFIYLRSAWPDALSYWWSLSVEEQFYLAWPCLIVFAPRRALRPIVMTAVATGPVFRAWLAAAGHPLEFAMVLTPGALDCLGIGALLALAKQRAAVPGESGPAFDVIGAAAGGMILALLFGHSRLALEATSQTVAGVCFAWVVWNAAAGFRGPAGWFLSCAPARYLGQISYGFYLVHPFAWAIVTALGVDLLAVPGVVRIGAQLLACLVVATVSWHLMERPVNDLKRHFPYGSGPDAPGTVRAGLAATPAC